MFATYVEQLKNLFVNGRPRQETGRLNEIRGNELQVHEAAKDILRLTEIFDSSNCSNKMVQISRDEGDADPSFSIISSTSGFRAIHHGKLTTGQLTFQYCYYAPFPDWSSFSNAQKLYVDNFWIVKWYRL